MLLIDRLKCDNGCLLRWDTDMEPSWWMHFHGYYLGRYFRWLHNLYSILLRACRDLCASKYENGWWTYRWKPCPYPARQPHAAAAVDTKCLPAAWPREPLAQPTPLRLHRTYLYVACNLRTVLHIDSVPGIPIGLGGCLWYGDYWGSWVSPLAWLSPANHFQRVTTGQHYQFGFLHLAQPQETNWSLFKPEPPCTVHLEQSPYLLPSISLLCAPKPTPWARFTAIRW